MILGPSDQLRQLVEEWLERWKNKTVAIGPRITLSFPLTLWSPALVMATIDRSQVAVVPTGFGQGGVVTFERRF